MWEGVCGVVGICGCVGGISILPGGGLCLQRGERSVYVWLWLVTGFVCGWERTRDWWCVRGRGTDLWSSCWCGWQDSFRQPAVWVDACGAWAADSANTFVGSLLVIGC